MNILDLVVGKPIKTSDERAEQIGPAQGISTHRQAELLTDAPQDCAGSGPLALSSVIRHQQTAKRGLRAAGRVCTNTSGDAGMKKASTRLLEQETQTPSPAPDLIPLNHQLRTYIGIGTANGGTSARLTRS